MQGAHFASLGPRRRPSLIDLRLYVLHYELLPLASTKKAI
eukprot:COSAG06_NODE_2049_length_7740_cov_9.497579_2_plen_40_part_00